jgi:dimethylargininase
MIEFTQAIARPPGATFSQGLSTAGLGPPDLALASTQHAAYCDALRTCGLTVTVLDADPGFPDAPFVEDTAVIAERVTIVTRPGAASRRGEVDSIRACLRGLRGELAEIRAPGTVDGGDVCQAGSHFFIGLSARTNADGAAQFGEIVRAAGYTASTIDVRGSAKLLHLKSGIAYLGDGRVLAVRELPRTAELAHLEIVEVDARESYAANCVRINDRVLVAAGYPRTAERLAALGYSPLLLEVSEFRKLDGGLSCLSLRF